MGGEAKADIVQRLREGEADPRKAQDLEWEAADEIERLCEALEELLCEAEDIFVCMADATGIDRHNFPLPFYKARAVLEGKL